MTQEEFDDLSLEETLALINELKEDKRLLVFQVDKANQGKDAAHAQTARLADQLLEKQNELALTACELRVTKNILDQMIDGLTNKKYGDLE